MYFSTSNQGVAYVLKTLSITSFFIVSSVFASAQFTSDDVDFWAGEGENSAVLVVDFLEDDEIISLAWGYHFDGETTGGEMLAAIAEADVALRVNADAFLNDIFYIDHMGAGGMPNYWGTWSASDGTDWTMNSGLGETVADGDWFGCTYTDFDPALEPNEPEAATNFENGPFAPPAEQEGTTAIAANDITIVGWASNCEVVRGPSDISDESSELASFGSETDATGEVDGTAVVSLGDGGTATLTFEAPIYNGPGPDFAIFENAFDDTFLELAFVEVSSDGETFVRFPAISLTQTETQVGAFDPLLAEQLHNFAGKYRANFGTPFDLEELADSSNINIEAITHVRIVDVVGSIEEDYATYDAHGFAVNDPFPTAFESSGFDLDGVGVMHSTVGVNEIASSELKVYPNPTVDFVTVDVKTEAKLQVLGLDGKKMLDLKNYKGGQVDVSNLPAGNYLVRVIESGSARSSIIVKN